MPLFEPTKEAALARLAAVNPAAYARTRNALDGAVTRLSPYLTHGLLSLREVYEAVHAKPNCPVVMAHAQPCLFEPVQPYCKSFSQWWRHTKIA